MAKIRVCDICGKEILGFPAILYQGGGYSVPNRLYKVKIEYSDGRRDKIEWCSSCMENFKMFLKLNNLKGKGEV